MSYARVENMTAKNAFVIVLKIVFLFFSIIFVRDAFFYWDGYSYYMRFTEFLPSLSLAFILWTAFALIFSFILWFAIYVFYKISPRFLNIRLEPLILIFLAGVMSVFSKRTYFEHISLSDVLGVSHYVLLILGGALLIGALLFLRKYAEKMLSWLNNSITPLVWLFTGLLILSVPLSFIRTGSSATDNTFVGGAEVHSDARKRPNIILVTMDALTARDMQLYGYERHTTPFISEWAKDAVVFDRVYSSSNWTSPSVMSLMTGQRPWKHNVWNQVYFNPVKNYEQNLPKILKDYGYSVYGFVQNESAHPETLGIKNAFSADDKAYTFKIPENWWFSKTANIFIERPIIVSWIFDNSPIAMWINQYRPDVHTTMVPPELVYNRFIKFITQSNNKNLPDKPNHQPFFAWLHVYPPHSPYLPPKHYLGMFGSAGIYDTRKKQFAGNLFGEYDITKQMDADIMRNRYDEFILYSDQQFKLFLVELSETIDTSNTIIILSSDHGESFSHGYMSHGGSHLYETFVHIPLIIQMPDRLKRKRIETPVEQIDIAPTILELAGVRKPEWMEGRSLLSLMGTKPFDSLPVFSMQLIKNRSFGFPITKGTIAVWEGDYKLIYYLDDKKTLLFNLKTDFDETKDIFKEKPDVGQKLLRLINEELSLANARIAKSNK